MANLAQVFRTMCDCWEIEPALARAWWHALQASRWSVPCEFRQKIGLFHRSKLIEPKRMLHDVCSPPQLMRVLEALVQERHLARRQATAIEECLLRYTDSRGGWYGACLRPLA